MAAEYELKLSPLTIPRIHKLAKNLIDESIEDRRKALEAYDYFKEKADSESLDEHGNTNSTAQKCMIDCLKLAQDSRNKTLKALELIIKVSKELKPKEKEKDEDFSFSDLDL